MAPLNPSQVPPNHVGRWQGRHVPWPRRVDPGKMTKPQLVMVYNALCDALLRVDSFWNYTTALNRVESILRKNHMMLVDAVTEDMHDDMITVYPHLYAVPTTFLPGLTGLRRSITRGDRRIEWILDHNPKTWGSKAASRWKLYEVGMTVDEYVQLGGRRKDVWVDLDKGFIRLSE